MTRRRSAAFVAIIGAALGSGCEPQNAYITTAGGNNVLVIATQTDAVTATIAVNGRFGVAVSADGRAAYVTNPDSNTVSVIDTTTSPPQPRATIAVGRIPQGVAVSPDSRKVYVTNSFDNTLSVIDMTANPPSVATIGGFGLPDFATRRLIGIAVSPDGGEVYVANGYGNCVWTVNTISNLATVLYCGNGFGPAGIAVSPDGGKVYIANFVGSALSVFDVTADPPTKSDIALGANAIPYGVAVTPDGGEVYVADLQGNVEAIDATKNPPPVTTIPVGFNPIGVAVTPDGLKAYVANNGSDSVSVIDTGSNTVIDTIQFPLGTAPIAFGVFIQPPRGFAGMPGSPSCVGDTIAGLTQEYGNLEYAVLVLHYPSVLLLQYAIERFCGRLRP